MPDIQQIMTFPMGQAPAQQDLIPTLPLKCNMLARQWLKAPLWSLAGCIEASLPDTSPLLGKSSVWFDSRYIVHHTLTAKGQTTMHIWK